VKRTRGRPSGYTRHRIYVALAERRLPVKWLAQEIGKDPVYMSRVLNGHKTITREFVDAVCRAFEMDEADLFMEDDLHAARARFLKSPATRTGTGRCRGDETMGHER